MDTPNTSNTIECIPTPFIPNTSHADIGNQVIYSSERRSHHMTLMDMSTYKVQSYNSRLLFPVLHSVHKEESINNNNVVEDDVEEGSILLGADTAEMNLGESLPQTSFTVIVHYGQDLLPICSKVNIYDYPTPNIHINTTNSINTTITPSNHRALEVYNYLYYLLTPVKHMWGKIQLEELLVTTATSITHYTWSMNQLRASTEGVSPSERGQSALPPPPEGVTKYLFNQVLPYIAYYFHSGPYKGCWCRFPDVMSPIHLEPLSLITSTTGVSTTTDTTSSGSRNNTNNGNSNSNAAATTTTSKSLQLYDPYMNHIDGGCTVWWSYQVINIRFPEELYSLMILK